MSEFNGGQVPPQQYPQYQAPQPKKKRTGLKIFLVVTVVCLVGLVSCVAVVGKAANDVSKDLQGENVPATSAPASDVTACKAVLAKHMVPYASRPAACQNVTGEQYMQIQGELRATEKPQATKTDDAPYAYSKLKVTKEDQLGMFEGTVVVANNTDKIREYYIEVTVFKGQQDVGTLNGTVKVKANSTGLAKLTSLDDYVSGATDYQVSITPGLG